MPFPKASRALERFTVLDLTRVRAGPTCVRQLADWGANVIKIELPPEPGGGEPLGGPREGSDFQNLHRNKRSMTLNLKAPAALAAFKRMVKKADVVVENFRPDVKRRLGIDYPQLRKINPKLVYASISGFGQSGPYADRPGFDQIAQGMGGLMSITGLPGQGPVRVGIPIADLSAGLFCALGILVALLEREKSKQGQYVATSLLQAQIFMLDFQGARWLIGGEVPGQAGNNHPTSILQRRQRERIDATSGISDRRRALQAPRRAQCRHGEIYRQAHERRVDRAAQQGGRSLRTDLYHRPGLCRPAGRAPRYGAVGEDQG
jgi:crotonobetainyl-CoA:carnitine CoA-transferase CaiB-like acyl-CoA transferase